MRLATLLLFGPICFWYLVAHVVTAVARRRKDTAWKPTGVKKAYTGHDETRSAVRHQREQNQAAQRRAKAARTIAELAQQRTITVFDAARAKRKAQR